MKTNLLLGQLRTHSRKLGPAHPGELGQVAGLKPQTVVSGDGERQSIDGGNPTSSELFERGPASIESDSPLHQTEGYRPVLRPVVLSEAQRKSKVPTEVLERAQSKLDEGDRGGAYLELYKELGNDQILVQTQITTYTGIWGSGALAGNSAAQDSAGPQRYNIPLDQFSTDIVQATIDGIHKDLEEGGTGRLTDAQFRAIDRKVWKDKGMGELFPGNVQFIDFWQQEAGDRGTAFFSKGTANMMGVAMRNAVPDVSVFGVRPKGRAVERLVGKRPAEFADDPNYAIFGGIDDRFVTVLDKRTGFVEAFYDRKPNMAGIPMPQLPNKKLDPNSPVFTQRIRLYDKLGANQSGRAQVVRGESNPAANSEVGWLLA